MRASNSSCEIARPNDGGAHALGFSEPAWVGAGGELRVRESACRAGIDDIENIALFDLVTLREAPSSGRDPWPN
jgi:hypothetical protein